eukprot:5905854-Amphidinium_carterae.2
MLTIAQDAWESVLCKGLCLTEDKTHKMLQPLLHDARQSRPHPDRTGTCWSRRPISAHGACVLGDKQRTASGMCSTSCTCLLS